MAAAQPTPVTPASSAADTTSPVTPGTPGTPGSRRRVRAAAGSEESLRLLPRPVLGLVIAVLMLFVLLPLAYVVLASLNSDLGVASGEVLPSSWHPENYAKIWETVKLAPAMVNSLAVAGTTAVVSAILAVLTAFVLVRFPFRGRVTFLRSLIVLQSIPGTLLILPIFVVFSSAATYLHVTVIGTRWGLVLTYLTFALPFATWTMVTYLRGLPKELEEAARIDGASNLRILRSIILPLSWPGVVVAGIFSFLLGWNDVVFAKVLTSASSHTAAVQLEAFSATAEGGAIPLLGQMMAASLVTAAPVVILYFVFQRYLVGGLTTGGVK